MTPAIQRQCCAITSRSLANCSRAFSAPSLISPSRLSKLRGGRARDRASFATLRSVSASMHASISRLITPANGERL